MAVDRTTPTSGPMSGTAYAAAVNEEVAALWNGVTLPLASVAGTDTISATATPTLDAYSAGQRFGLTPVNDNTGAVTLNIDSRGAKAVVDAEGVALEAGALIAGRYHEMAYDGTSFRLHRDIRLFDVATFVGGVPSSAELVLRYEFRTPVTFPAGLTGSRASAEAASTGTAEFSLEKNGVEFGTVTFTSSATGVFAAASATSFAAGDVLRIVAPGPADASLAGISITLAGQR